MNNNDRTQPYVVIDYGTGSRAPSGSGGLTLTTPTGGPIGIVLVDDETGDIEVPETWALKPSAVSAGNKFRLMYMTSEGGAATSSDIEDYDEFVRTVGARGGHQDILPYIGFFKTFGNTRTTTATNQNVAGRGHVGMWSSGSNVWTDGSTSASSSGAPIYWLNGTKISDNYYDFCDNSWDNRWSSGTNHLKHEDGNAADGSKVWTGMANNCALHSNALGHASQVSWGPGTQTPSGGPLRKGQEASANTNRFYGMSPEFKVELPPVPPVPPKPTGFTATAGNGQVTLSWNDPNRSTITSWQYRQKAGSGSYGSFMTISGSSASTTSHTVTGLTNGVTYTFQVFAVASNAGGSVNGLPSDERTATPMAPPELTFGSATYSGGEGSGTIAVTVNASSAPSSALTVNLTTANGSATGGTDFTAPAATFTFPASATTHTISVAITQDNAVESNETFTLTLTAGSGYTVGSPASTTITITNDDTAPPPISGARGLALTPSQLYVVEGGNATFSVRLTARPSSAVAVTVTSPNSEILLSSGAEGETPGQTLTLSFVLSQWDVPLPVVVSGVVDSDKVDDTATLSLTASGGGYGAVTGSVDVTVTDRQWARGWDFAKFFVHNTEPGDAILKYDWPVWEDGGAGFWVTRTNVYKGPTSDWYNAHTHGDVSHPAHKDTWINIPNPWSFKMCFGGTATLWVDYGVWTDIQFDGNCTERIELPGPTGPPEYRPGWDRKLFYLNVLDDNHEDSGETIVITLQDPQGVSLPFYFLGGETLTYTIHNDDPPLVPEALISHDTGPVTEGDPARFALLINPRPATPTDVTVKLTGAHGYLASGQSRTLTVPVPTSGFATFEVPTVGDNVRESDAKIIATVIKGDGYQPDRDPGDATASVMVQDDDPNGIAPVLSITADAASIAEGAAARYTITADPKPNAPLRVSVTVSQDGHWGVKTGTRTVVVGTTGTATIKVDTADDTRYEPDGSVTVAIDDHYDYDLDATATTATVAVTSDDIKLPQVSISDATVAETERFIRFDITLDKPAANAVYVSMALDSGTAKYGEDFIRLASSVTIPAGQTSGRYEVYIFGDSTPEGPETFTARIYRVSGGPAEVRATQGAATGTITDIAAAQNTEDPAEPEISIASDGDITEGSAASFTVTASPAPASALDVTVEVSQSGDYGATTGAQTVTIPTGGSYTLTVATSNDSADEADGSVTATVNTGSGYTVSATAGAATVAVSDDDPPSATPEISISAGSGVTEGSDATFTVTASPAPAADLTVSVSVSQSGDFGVTTGAQTVTIPASGSYTLTVATTNDSDDEADGSVTATVDSGTGYTVSATTSTATVAVADDDDPPSATPEISIAAGSGVTEGNSATFTITASPTPQAALPVSVSVTQSGDYGVITGARTVTIPASGSYTLTVATGNDSADEADGSVTATVDTGTGYTVSATAGTATVAVADDDDPPPATPEISIAAGNGVTEGSDASFTITANPTPAAGLTVSVSVSQSGDFGVTTGVQTVTIPAGGSYTLTVATSDDSTDEADGSVTATLNTGTGYTVSATASAATVAVSDDDDTPPSCTIPSDAISVAEVTGWRDALDANKAAAGIKRWNRVLATLGQDTGHTPMTAEQARQVADWLGNTRWDRTARTLEAMEQCDNPPPATPEISIAAGSGVTEGSDATFTVTASPTPQAALPVSVSVSQSGDFGVSTGAQTVTIPTGGSYTLTVATTGDSTDEADGSVTATVDTGTGYTVSATAGTATVAVADDDDPPPACALPADAITVAEVTGWRDALDANKAAAGIKRWNRVLATFGEDTGHTPMTAEQARQVADWLGNTRWDRTARTLEAMAQCAS